MKLWIACILSGLALLGIVLLVRRMRGKSPKTGYILGITALTMIALALMAYVLLTLLFVSAVQ